MRYGWALIGALAIGCAGPPPLRAVSTTQTAKASPKAAASRVRVLPAGIFFRAHTYRPCDHVEEREQPASGLCTDPRAAVVSGVFARESDAQRALDAARKLELAPGYPFAAHTDELGLEDGSRQGTAVILGLFEQVRDARLWLADHPIGGAELVGLLDADAAFARYDQSAQHFAVMIDSATPVPAYAARHFEWTDDGDPGGVVPGRTQPLCHVQPGSLFIADGESLRGTWYEWAPVRCGRALAYVAWTSTRLTATIWQRSNGARELLQIVEVSCDSPTFGAWKLDRNQRRIESDEEEKVATAISPCGG